MNREKPSITRFGITHKATIMAMPDDGSKPEPVEFFITANAFPDGRLAEIFVCTRKEGTTINGLLDAVSTLTSVCLQSGWPLYKLVEKFSHSKFAPMGRTIGETPVRYAKSILDYVFRYLGEVYGGMPADLVHPTHEEPVDLEPSAATVVIPPDPKAEAERQERIAAHDRWMQAWAEEDSKNQAAAAAWNAAHPITTPALPADRPMP